MQVNFDNIKFNTFYNSEEKDTIFFLYDKIEPKDISETCVLKLFAISFRDNLIREYFSNKQNFNVHLGNDLEELKGSQSIYKQLIIRHYFK